MNRNPRVNISKLQMLQLNTQHSWKADILLRDYLVRNNIDIAFVQEPYMGNKIVCAPKYREYMIGQGTCRPRSKIIVNNSV